MVLGNFVMSGFWTVSRACFKFFSKTFLASQNPCFVFPNEFGPADVGVSLKNYVLFTKSRFSVTNINKFLLWAIYCDTIGF